MSEYLFSMTVVGDDHGAGGDDATPVTVRPNLWLMSHDEIPPLLFTAEEVARLLHLNRGSVYRLMRTGELLSIKVGGCRRVSARALSRFVEQQDGWG